MTLSTYAHVIDEVNGAERVTATEAIKNARDERQALDVAAWERVGCLPRIQTADIA